MPTPDTHTVFIDARKVVVPLGATVRDALVAWGGDAARDVDAGLRVVTDSRGLPIDPGEPVYGGAIFRLVSARDRGAPTDAELH